MKIDSLTVFALFIASAGASLIYEPLRIEGENANH